MKKPFLFISLISVPAMLPAGTPLSWHQFAKQPSATLLQPSAPQFQIIDKIIARVNGVNIFLSDLTSPSILRNGTSLIQSDVLLYNKIEEFKPALETMIDEVLLFLRASELKVLPSTLDIEKQILASKAHYGISHTDDDAFEAILRNEGLTIKKYKDQLLRALAIQSLKQLEMNERVLVTSQEAQEYYNKHKQIVPEHYLLKTATIKSRFLVGKPTKKDLLMRDDLVWHDLPPINKVDVASHLTCIFSMNAGDVSEPILTPSGNYQLVMLIKKESSRTKTFEESYIDIEKILTEAKKTRFEQELKSDLRKTAIIIYF